MAASNRLNLLYLRQLQVKIIMAANLPTSAKVVTGAAASGGISSIVPDIFLVVQAILPASWDQDVRSAAARVIIACVVYVVVHRIGWTTSDNRTPQEEQPPERGRFPDEAASPVS